MERRPGQEGMAEWDGGLGRRCDRTYTRTCPDGRRVPRSWWMTPRFGSRFTTRCLNLSQAGRPCEAGSAERVGGHPHRRSGAVVTSRVTHTCPKSGRFRVKKAVAIHGRTSASAPDRQTPVYSGAGPRVNPRVDRISSVAPYSSQRCRRNSARAAGGIGVPVAWYVQQEAGTVNARREAGRGVCEALRDTQRVQQPDLV